MARMRCRRLDVYRFRFGYRSSDPVQPLRFAGLRARIRSASQAGEGDAMKNILPAILLAACTALAEPERTDPMPADSLPQLPTAPMPNPEPQPSSSPLPLIGKIAVGTLLFGVVESGIILYSAGFAGSPLGGSAFAGVFGLLAAINAGGPEGSKITLWQTGGVIAYNLIRFGPALEVSERRSERIFTENMILMNGALAAGLTYGLIKERRARGKVFPVSLAIGPDQVAMARTWRF